MFALLSALLRPLVRLTVGLIAIPLFRLFARRVLQWDRLNAELTKDIEQWVRGALLLLLATANFEFFLLDSLRHHLPRLTPPPSPPAESLLESHTFDPPPTVAPLPVASPTPPRTGWAWLSLALRLLLAIGVIEAMPDQALFSIIHLGPLRLLFPKGRRLQAAREQLGPFCLNLFYRHLDRSSAVFAILSVMLGGRTNVTVGWACYFIAIVQFLAIGLIASRDKAIGILTQFDQSLASRREQLIRDLRQFD